MPWLSSVPAVLEAWYPGQEEGNAVANLLFGVVNPSGKLQSPFRQSSGSEQLQPSNNGPA
jgi:beta-glucosidase